MIERVHGYVDGEPVIYAEAEPTNYIGSADIEPQTQHEVEIDAEDDHGNVGKFRSVVYLSGEWIPPIWQRTQNDVDLAARLSRTPWRRFTDSEKNAYLAGLIGALNYYDLNRIEHNTEYLAAALRAYGYGPNRSLHNTGWEEGTYPYRSELERVRANTQTLIDIYYEQGVDIPGSIDRPVYTDINAIERMLQLMYEMIGRMEQSFTYCGTMYCGEVLL